MEEHQHLHESTESASPITHSESDSPPVTTAAAAAGETLPPPVNVSADLSGKKKRGRPRKYDSDGNLRVPIVKSPIPILTPPPPGFTLSSSSANRSSSNWNMVSSSLGEIFGETAGADFTPHVVNVLPGEDVAGKILSISQKGPLGICILAANGVVSNVTLRQPGSAGGILTYEGRFEILSLSGSFTISESGGVRSRSGGLSVSLAGPDGRIIGGGVAGLLMAATPIQIVAGSFVPNVIKMQNKRRQEHYEPVSAANVVISAIPVSQAAPVMNNTVQQIPDVSPLPDGADNKVNVKSISLSTSTHEWNGPDPGLNQRVYPDINASAPE